MNITKQLNKNTTLQIIYDKIIISTKMIVTNNDLIISKNKKAYLLVTSKFDYKPVVQIAEIKGVQ